MSDVQHSATPWNFDRIADIEDREGRDLITVTSADGKLICLLGPGNLTGRDLEERIANMEFTARACSAHDDLLAACKRALQIVGAMADGSSMIEHARAMYEPEAVCREMHAAIAKATADRSPA